MRIAARETFLILLLALVPALASAVWHPRRPSWTSDEVTATAAESWGKRVLWIDARPDADYQKGHVPGAVQLNEDRWEELLPAMLDAWSGKGSGVDVVVYCSSLSCQTSRDVARRLRDEVKLPNVFVLQGGWEGWKKSQ